MSDDRTPPLLSHTRPIDRPVQRARRARRVADRERDDPRRRPASRQDPADERRDGARLPRARHRARASSTCASSSASRARSIARRSGPPARPQPPAASPASSVQPNTSPPLDDGPSIDFVKRRAQDRCIVRVHPMAALTKGCAGKEMTEFGLLKEAGAVAYTDGAKALTNPQVLRRARSLRPHVRRAGGPALRGSRSRRRRRDERGRVRGEAWPAWRAGARRDDDPGARPAHPRRATGGRYHVALVSCVASLEILRKAKAAGLKVTAGVSINNLTFNENDNRRLPHLLQALAAAAGRDAARSALAEAVARG